MAHTAMDAIQEFRVNQQNTRELDVLWRNVNIAIKSERATSMARSTVPA